MNRRPAVTLIEALMAIFVMAIGLLALLTLFPLGALTMAQALKDQRTTETASNATSAFKALQLGNDQNVNLPIPGGNGLSLFQDPWPQILYGGNSLPMIPNGPGYPVYIDPLYVSLDGFTPTYNRVVGQASGSTGGIRRLTVAGPMSANPTRWCTLQDDIYFADNGAPDPGFPGVPIPREGRYTLAYMVRRATANSADLPLDLTVVVYSGRQPGPDLTVVPSIPIGESPYISRFVSDRVIQLTWLPGAQAKPKVRRGTWLLDARMSFPAVPFVSSDPNMQPFNPTGPLPAPQGYFYRVTNVNDVLGDGVLEVEVQSPNGGPIPAGYWGNIPFTVQPIQGTVIVMDNVSEVFARGTNY